MPSSDFRIGEVITLACPPADARVVRVGSQYIFLEWPWREVDSDSKARWNGQVALPREIGSYEWLNTPWRVDPDASQLEAGDACMVGIPATRVIVRAVLLSARCLRSLLPMPNSGGYLSLSPP